MQAAEQHDAAEWLLAAEQRRRWWTPLRRDSGWNAYPSTQTRDPRQTSNQIWHDLQTGMTRQVSTLNVLASSQQPKQSRPTTTWKLQILSNDEHDTIRTTWHVQHDTARTIRAWHKHMNMMRLACNMMKLSCITYAARGYLVTITCITYHHEYHTIISGSNQAWY